MSIQEQQAEILEQAKLEEWQPSDCPLLDWHRALDAGAAALREQERTDVPVDELRSAVGLVASERNRWEGHDSKTHSHWERIYTILAGFLLAEEVRADLALRARPLDAGAAALREQESLRLAFDAGATWVAQVDDPARSKLSMDRGFADFMSAQGVRAEADNHHNALACPYCVRNLAELYDGKIGELQAEIERLKGQIANALL